MSGRISHPPTRQLPERPNLDQLRKQAKDLLEDYRNGDAAAVVEVERFEQRPDPKIFALHDAQRVLARAYGYTSWAKLKAFVDGVTVATFVEAAKSGDMTQVRTMLASRPELVGMDMAENNEHRALHYAVLRRDPEMVRLLMEAGADARKGIYPHRDATSALTLARDREYHDIVAVIENEERLRREEMSCPNATVSPVQDRISAAISHGDTATAIELLEADRTLIQACDREGASPLHIAAEETNAELVEWLLERRADVHKEDMSGFTPLDRAALAADSRNDTTQEFRAVASLLLGRGAKLTMRGAVALGNQQRVREMVEANPEFLRPTSHHGGLLTLAVNHGQLELVRLLLDLGADVDERLMLDQVEEQVLSWGMPLWHAALAGNLEITRLLLDRGADPNANVYASGWPLRNAWNHEDPSVKLLLLERGAKPQPYMVSENHDIEEATRLLQADASEALASELAWSAADNGCPEIVEMAIAHLDWPPNDYRWHWILIQPIRGAGPDSSRNEGHLRSMEVLLRRGLDPNISRYGETILHFAAADHHVSEEDRARFAAMLVDHGARLDVRDDLLKSTPLGWACRWGRTKMVETLIQHGAAIHEPDAEPWATPEAWARKMNRQDVLELLK